MRELSDEARAILDLTRDADDPAPSDRRRLTAAMVGQLGAAAALTSAASSGAAAGAGVTAAATVGTGTAVKVLASMAVAGLLGGGAAWHQVRSEVARAPAVAARPAAMASAPALRVEPSMPTEVVAQPAPEIGAPAASSAPSSSSVAPRARAPRVDALALEVGVVGEARRALVEGRPDRALALLDEHAETFARGALREEFLASRVLALRALGRTAEARAALERFVAEMPHSALAAGLAGADESAAGDGRNR
jgi:hypothetical protein